MNDDGPIGLKASASDAKVFVGSGQHVHYWKPLGIIQETSEWLPTVLFFCEQCESLVRLGVPDVTDVAVRRLADVP